MRLKGDEENKAGSCVILEKAGMISSTGFCENESTRRELFFNSFLV